MLFIKATKSDDSNAFVIEISIFILGKYNKSAQSNLGTGPRRGGL